MKMLALAAIAVGLMIAPVLAEARPVPSAGSCTFQGSFQPIIARWDSKTNSAYVQDGDKTMRGPQILAVRAHGKGWKVNIRYRNEFNAPAEIVLFEGDDPKLLRGATFTYDEIGNVLAIASTSSFKDAQCIVEK